jgi:hypothetical protein
MTMRTIATLAVCLVLVHSSGADAQVIRSGVFLTTLGKDTVSVEKYTRTRDRLEGHILTPIPRAIEVHYTVDFDANGNAKQLNLIGTRADAPAGTPALLERKVTVVGDTVINDIKRNGQVDTTATGRLIIARGSLPYISNSTAMLEEAVQQFRRAQRDSVGVSFFVFGPQGAGPATPLQRFKGDTLMLVNGPGQTPLLYVDGQGRLQLVDARLTTVRTRTRRVADADMARIAASFAQRGVVGILSVRDTADATVGGAALKIDYSRPLARGRRVFGALVPYGEVWRAGANLATHVTTSRDLQIGTARVPAGTYTLWVMPRANADSLVINKQTTQWGTMYDPSLDLARVPMTTKQTPQHVEQFTIDIEGNGPSGEIVLSWERRQMRVPFRVLQPPG